jgi:hypothetical protein
MSGEFKITLEQGIGVTGEDRHYFLNHKRILQSKKDENNFMSNSPLEYKKDLRNLFTGLFFKN